MRLTYRPCHDSADIAAAAQSALATSRGRARVLGRETLAIVRRGGYTTAGGGRMDLQPVIDASVAGTVSIPADADLPEAGGALSKECIVAVRNETTLRAAQILADRHDRVLVLNLANGVQPGGGWLDGSRAQEEVLCRSSALYPSIEADPMYAEHARRDLPDSTDSAILSPHVAVFRDDPGELLPRPWQIDVITCAAPYAPTVGQPRSGELLARRIGRILDIAAAYRYEALVLGAWGCGAYGNDPSRTAADFHSALRDRSGEFREVVFAITDWSHERRFLGPFRDEFAAPIG